jgi:plasmid stabilization system protein ParE
MQIRWSPDAAADLDGMVEYIRLDNPIAARRVGKSIYDRLTVLRDFPYGGRVGRFEGTRELPFAAASVHRGVPGSRIPRRLGNCQHSSWCAAMATDRVGLAKL